jgi:hypothetical protein
MQTHFVRRQPRGNPILSPVEGLVLRTIPDDRLVTVDEIFPKLAELAKKEGEASPRRQFLDGLLAKLVKDGFVYEVHPVRIKKMLEQI